MEKVGYPFMMHILNQISVKAKKSKNRDPITKAF